jgi:hypothetical protein
MIWKDADHMSDQKKAQCLVAIRRNCIEAIQTLLVACDTLQVPLSDATLVDAKEEIIGLNADSVTLNEELGAKISNLWKDPGLQTVWNRRSEFWCMDATSYYLQEVERLASEDCEATDDDMIMTRVRTTGIVVTQILEPPYVYQIVDVGGQRSERRKWIHCFDTVKAIIFLEGLAGYNQVLFEDNSMNRMKESMNLFVDVIKNPIFANTPIFVFLNKKDLFETMIQTQPLTVCFPEYDGELGDVQGALSFITKKYEDLMKEHGGGRQVYVHIIAARVRRDIKIAFGEVKETLKKLDAAPSSKSSKSSPSRVGSYRIA